MIDTHAHIYLPHFDRDRPAMLQRAKASGVQAIYMPNIDTNTLTAMLAVQKKNPTYCYSMLGLHPCAVGADFKVQLAELELALGRHHFIAIGEIGLDLYHDKTFFEAQQEVFCIQSEWAKQNQLPVVIHSRNAMSETIALLENCKDENYSGVVHCFTGTVEEAEQIIALGFRLGIGGVATFKKGGLEPVLEQIDLQHLMLETDSPYLSPSPHRSKRNEPAHLIHIATKIAQIKNITTAKVIAQTTQNAINLFKQNPNLN